MSIYVAAFLIGVVAGLRSMTAPAVVSWAVRLGWLHLEYRCWVLQYAPYILSLGAIAELVTDQLPKTPSRKAPGPFAVRLVVGAVCGAAIGVPSQAVPGGIVAGVLGAVAGTLGGYEVRTRAAKALGRDLPIALIEDAIAIGGAFLVLSQLS